jgi:ArsR family transcriptional regulator, arsenate/arsenite/antimonite-responsive transcriptional repressor / arsenate reductase (thioredoxin)
LNSAFIHTSGLIEESRALDALSCLGQATRLAVVRHLLSIHPDALAAGEIAKLCGVPQNTMSTHLSTLTQAGLVRVERQGRAMNYRVDLDGFRGVIGFLAQDCCQGRPDLCADVFRPAKLEPLDSNLMHPAFNVLFLCTHNSARSIMAQALLEKIGQGRFNAYSAGSHPASNPMPEVIDRLKAMGHPVENLRCKSWDEFTGANAPRMDFVIGLCDTLEGQKCPDLGEKFVTAAWPLPDPAKFIGSPAERATLLNELYAMVRRRLEIFCSLPFASLDRLAVTARLNDIGTSSWKTA